jgi:hypothetical protein
MATRQVVANEPEHTRSLDELIRDGVALPGGGEDCTPAVAA